MPRGRKRVRIEQVEDPLAQSKDGYEEPTTDRGRDAALEAGEEGSMISTKRKRSSQGSNSKLLKKKADNKSSLSKTTPSSYLSSIEARAVDPPIPSPNSDSRSSSLTPPPPSPPLRSFSGQVRIVGFPDACYSWSRDPAGLERTVNTNDGDVDTDTDEIVPDSEPERERMREACMDEDDEELWEMTGTEWLNPKAIENIRAIAEEHAERKRLHPEPEPQLERKRSGARRRQSSRKKPALVRKHDDLEIVPDSDPPPGPEYHSDELDEPARADETIAMDVQEDVPVEDVVENVVEPEIPRLPLPPLPPPSPLCQPRPLSRSNSESCILDQNLNHVPIPVLAFQDPAFEDSQLDEPVFTLSPVDLHDSVPPAQIPVPVQSAVPASAPVPSASASPLAFKSASAHDPASTVPVPSAIDVASSVSHHASPTRAHGPSLSLTHNHNTQLINEHDQHRYLNSSSQRIPSLYSRPSQSPSPPPAPTRSQSPPPVQSRSGSVRPGFPPVMDDVNRPAHDANESEQSLPPWELLPDHDANNDETTAQSLPAGGSLPDHDPNKDETPAQSLPPWDPPPYHDPNNDETTAQSLPPWDPLPDQTQSETESDSSDPDGDGEDQLGGGYSCPSEVAFCAPSSTLARQREERRALKGKGKGKGTATATGNVKGQGKKVDSSTVNTADASTGASGSGAGAGVGVSAGAEVVITEGIVSSDSAINNTTTSNVANSSLSVSVSSNTSANTTASSATAVDIDIDGTHLSNELDSGFSERIELGFRGTYDGVEGLQEDLRGASLERQPLESDEGLSGEMVEDHTALVSGFEPVLESKLERFEDLIDPSLYPARTAPVSETEPLLEPKLERFEDVNDLSLFVLGCPPLASTSDTVQPTSHLPPATSTPPPAVSSAARPRRRLSRAERSLRDKEIDKLERMKQGLSVSEATYRLLGGFYMKCTEQLEELRAKVNAEKERLGDYDGDADDEEEEQEEQDEGAEDEGAEDGFEIRRDKTTMMSTEDVAAIMKSIERLL